MLAGALRAGMVWLDTFCLRMWQAAKWSRNMWLFLFIQGMMAVEEARALSGEGVRLVMNNISPFSSH